MNKSKKFSPEMRERAVRMVQEQRGEYPSLWAAIESIAPKIGCVPQTLHEWVKRQEVDAGVREGVTTGEAQRVKLATELSRRPTGRTLYILDEPTTGLHIADVDKLLQVLQALVDTGNSMVIIEHNLDVIKSADHVIDMGPEGGDGGGQVVATGTPEQVAKVTGSFTGQYLKAVLD